jgi:hypothetical protein
MQTHPQSTLIRGPGSNKVQAYTKFPDVEKFYQIQIHSQRYSNPTAALQ